MALMTVLVTVAVPDLDVALAVETGVATLRWGDSGALTVHSGGIALGPTALATVFRHLANDLDRLAEVAHPQDAGGRTAAH